MILLSYDKITGEILDAFQSNVMISQRNGMGCVEFTQGMDLARAVVIDGVVTKKVYLTSKDAESFMDVLNAAYDVVISKFVHKSLSKRVAMDSSVVQAKRHMAGGKPSSQTTAEAARLGISVISVSTKVVDRDDRLNEVIIPTLVSIFSASESEVSGLSTASTFEEADEIITNARDQFRATRVANQGDVIV